MPKYNVNHIDHKLVRYFVRGAVDEYCDQSGALGPIEFEKRRVYMNDTLDIVWRYLRFEGGLDVACSDMQCSVAHEAFKVFKPVLEVDMWKEECRVILRRRSVNDTMNAIIRCRELTGADLEIARGAVHQLRSELFPQPTF